MTSKPALRSFRVLVPYAEEVYRAEPHPIAPRLPDLRSARIGFVDNGFTAVAAIHEEVRRRLEALGITYFIEHKRYWQGLTSEQLDRLCLDADAVVGGLCNTPPSTAWGARDAIAIEKRATPTVTFATDYYEDLLAECALTEGMPDLRRIVLPYPLEGQPGTLVQAVADRSTDLVVAALTNADGERVSRVTVDSMRT